MAWLSSGVTYTASVAAGGLQECRVRRRECWCCWACSYSGQGWRIRFGRLSGVVERQSWVARGSRSSHKGCDALFCRSAPCARPSHPGCTARAVGCRVHRTLPVAHAAAQFAALIAPYGAGCCRDRRCAVNPIVAVARLARSYRGRRESGCCGRAQGALLQRAARCSVGAHLVRDRPTRDAPLERPGAGRIANSATPCAATQVAGRLAPCRAVGCHRVAGKLRVH